MLLHATPIAALAAVLLAAGGLRDNASVQVTTQEAQAPVNAAARADAPNAEEASAIKTRKASCRCGRLTATYEGPDPERITLCHCNSCQLRTGTVFSVQARFSRERVTIEGDSTTWTFPGDSERVTYRTCDSGGATYHFCPVCGTTVYWDIAAAPDFIGIAVGALTDPTLPPPQISGFESYGHPWAMKAADLPIKRLDLAE
jgi:hypothetical protein